MVSIDVGEEKLKSLIKEVREYIQTIVSEEDAKVKIINRIFHESKE